MGFIDNNTSTILAILTKRGRELIAKNNGEFKITQFALSDDEINYSLYNADTGNDSDILNLPILEPSSNENSALRYRLITLPNGSMNVAFITATPTEIILQNSNSLNKSLSNFATITVMTENGSDNNGYTVNSRNKYIASIPVLNATQVIDNKTIITIKSGTTNGTTYIDIIGKDSGAVISIPVTVSDTFTNSTQ